MVFVLQKQWAVFDFAKDKLYSLMVVPSSWVRSMESKEAGKTKAAHCYWPQQSQGLNITKLIKTCSEPDISRWHLVPGFIKGHFNTWAKGVALIRDRVGTVSTTTDTEDDVKPSQVSAKGEAFIREQAGTSTGTTDTAEDLQLPQKSAKGEAFIREQAGTSTATTDTAEQDLQPSQKWDKLAAQATLTKKKKIVMKKQASVVVHHQLQHPKVSKCF